MAKHGKQYQEAAKAIDRDKIYSPSEALSLAKETAKAKFDETVELHLRTNSDPRHADQLIRGVTLLTHGLGKDIRVLVFAAGEAANAARQAGADYVGDDDLVKKIEGGWVDFDVAIATPDLMGKIGRLGRVLGRRGLMPNPRTGTMVQARELRRTIEEAKAGRLEYRTARTSIIHSQFGKASFGADALLENLSVLVDAIMRDKPDAVKGSFLRTAFMTTTMGPSIAVDVASLQALKPAD